MQDSLGTCILRSMNFLLGGVKEHSIVSVSGSCCGKCDRRVPINRCHERWLSAQVFRIVLNNVKRVYPEVTGTKLMCDCNGVLKSSGKWWPWNLGSLDWSVACVVIYKEEPQYPSNGLDRRNLLTRCWIRIVLCCPTSTAGLNRAHQALGLAESILEMRGYATSMRLSPNIQPIFSTVKLSPEDVFLSCMADSGSWWYEVGFPICSWGQIWDLSGDITKSKQIKSASTRQCENLKVNKSRLTQEYMPNACAELAPHILV